MDGGCFLLALGGTGGAGKQLYYPQRSGVSRMWLIEHYTRLWAAREQSKSKPAKKNGKARSRKESTTILDIERSLDALELGFANIAQAQQFIERLVRHTKTKKCQMSLT